MLLGAEHSYGPTLHSVHHANFTLFSFYMCFCGPFEWSYFLIMSLALYRSQLEAA